MMHTKDIIVLVLESIEITQNIVIALFLVLMYFNKSRKKLVLLALYFFSYAIASIIQAGVFFNILTQELRLLPYVLHFVAYSFFYAHINTLLVQEHRNKIDFVFLIASVFIIVGLVFTGYSFVIKQPLIASVFTIYPNISFSFLIITSVFLLIKIKRHNTLINKQYSTTDTRSLSFMFYWIITFALYLFLSSFLPLDIVLEKSIQTIISLLFTLALIYHTLLYQVSKDLFSTTAIHRKINEKSRVASPLDTSDILIKKIEDQLQRTSLYLNPECTISNLADLVGVHPKLVSKTINIATNQNFNTYINTYRVIYAKQMLLKKENRHLSIEGIGKLSGFRSNSTFYSAFKKQLSCTPLAFQKRHLAR